MKSKKGFTLIELLIVIAIIAVLAVAFLPQVLGAPSKGRDAQRLAQMQKLQQFLTADSVSGKALLDTGCIDKSKTDVKEIGGYINSKLSDFGGVFPTDPKGDNEAFGAVANCKGQYGYMKFDNPKDVGFVAAIYVAMENVENANANCSVVKDKATKTKFSLDPGNKGATIKVDALGTNAACYVALIQ